MLRSFVGLAPFFGWRTAHRELAAGNRHHVERRRPSRRSAACRASSPFFGRPRRRAHAGRRSQSASKTAEAKTANRQHRLRDRLSDFGPFAPDVGLGTDFRHVAKTNLDRDRATFTEQSRRACTRRRPILLLAGTIVPAASRGRVGAEALEYRQILMGVPVRILVYARDKGLANAAVHAAFDRIRQLNLIFSDYDEDSEISRLCRTRRRDSPSPSAPSWRRCWRFARSVATFGGSIRRHGRTAGQLVAAIAAHTNDCRLRRNLRPRKERVGYRGRSSRRRTSDGRTADKPDMRLDFGGIVKGYAADEARAVLASHGFKQTLVGSVGRHFGRGSAARTSRVGKSACPGSSLRMNGPKDFVWLANRAVSTAGDTFQFVEIDGKRYSHLVDPKTGLGITRRVSVTVIAPTGLLSDGLDSAAAILGPEKGLKLLETTPGVSGRFVELTPTGPKTCKQDLRSCRARRRGIVANGSPANRRRRSSVGNTGGRPQSACMAVADRALWQLNTTPS